MSEHELWNELGNLYFMSGAYEQAVHAYHHSIQLDQNYGRPYSNLALIYARRGQHPMAVELFRTSIELLSDNTEKAVSWNRLGNLHRQARDYDQALVAFQRADDLDPVCKDGREDLGQMLFATTDLTILEQAHRIKESEPPVPDLEVVVEPGAMPATEPQQSTWKPIEHEVALEAIDEAAEAEWLTPWIDVPDSQHDSLPAAPVDEDQPDFISDDPEHEDLAYVLPERFPLQFTIPAPRPEPEIEVATQPSTAGPASFGEPGVLVGMQADLAEVAKESQPAAAAEISSATTSAADGPEEAENSEAEFAKLRRMVQINPRNAQAWDSLGSLHKSIGQYREAIVAYQQAISIDSSRADYYHHLGLVHAIVGQNEDAIMALQKVLEYAPDHSLAHATLGGYFRKMGLEELAQKHIGKAMKNIYDSESEYNRACFEAIRGNVDQAIELLRIALENRQTYAEWVVHDPDLDFIRDDPRFRQLVSDYTR